MTTTTATTTTYSLGQGLTLRRAQPLTGPRFAWVVEGQLEGRPVRADALFVWGTCAVVDAITTRERVLPASAWQTFEKVFGELLDAGLA